jgi:hypothetical protein
VPRCPARRGIVFTTFSRRRVGLRWAQEPSAPIGVLQDIRRSFATPWLPRDRKPIFFGLPGTASSRQRLFLWDGPIAPSSPIPSEVRPFEPWCHHRGSCICAATCARSASRFVAHRPRPGGFRWVCMYRSASQIGAYRSSCISLSMYSFASLKPRSSLISVRRPDTIPTFLLFSVFAYANGSPV